MSFARSSRRFSRLGRFAQAWAWVGLTVLVVAWAAGSLWLFANRFDWMPLFGATAAEPEPVDVAPTRTPAADPPPTPVPAEAVLISARDAAASALGVSPQPVPSLSGPFGFRCGPQSSGPQPRLLAAALLPSGQPAAVELGAYGAGLGAPAVDDLRNHFDSCDGVRVRSAPSLGSGAFLVSTDDVSEFWWRRGDVVARFAVRGPVSEGVPSAVSATDAALLAALDGVCADIAAGPEAALRNPLVDGFTGLFETRAVSAEPLTPPADPALTVPVPVFPDYTGPFTDPSQVPPQPDPLVTRRPTDPGSAPQAPITLDYRVRVPDRTGPGCGWEFAGTVAPVQDPAALTLEAAAARDRATAELTAARDKVVASWAAWTASRSDWAVKSAAYDAYRRWQQAVAQATTTTTTTTTTAPPTTTTTPVVPEPAPPSTWPTPPTTAATTTTSP